MIIEVFNDSTHLVPKTSKQQSSQNQPPKDRPTTSRLLFAKENSQLRVSRRQAVQKYGLALGARNAPQRTRRSRRYYPGAIESRGNRSHRLLFSL